MADKHSFDFVAVKKKLGLDTYGGIRMINFLRIATDKGLTSVESIEQLLKTASQWTKLDEYLKPFMMDDALIFGMHESDGRFSEDESDGQTSDGTTKGQLQAKILSLQRTVETLTEQLRLFYAPSPKNKINQSINQKVKSFVNVVPRLAHPELAAMTVEESKEQDTKSKFIQQELHSEDTDYFQGYSERNIHEEMLRDKPRTEAYKQFFEKNKQLIQGKTVLDIGCGTSILCLFAAKAGAERVVGIDRADIIDKARQVVKDNGFDGVISLVKAKVEEADLPVDKVLANIHNSFQNKD